MKKGLYYLLLVICMMGMFCGCKKEDKTYDKPLVVMGTRLGQIRQAEDNLRSDNTSGVKGVCSQNGGWVATLGFRGVHYRKHCSRFEEAVETRRKMKAVHEEFLEWWDGLSPEERAGAAASYENDKQAQYVLLKERIDNLK